MHNILAFIAQVRLLKHGVFRAHRRVIVAANKKHCILLTLGSGEISFNKWLDHIKCLNMSLAHYHSLIRKTQTPAENMYIRYKSKELSEEYVVCATITIWKKERLLTLVFPGE